MQTHPATSTAPVPRQNSGTASQQVRSEHHGSQGGTDKAPPGPSTQLAQIRAPAHPARSHLSNRHLPLPSLDALFKVSNRHFLLHITHHRGDIIVQELLLQLPIHALSFSSLLPKEQGQRGRRSQGNVPLSAGGRSSREAGRQNKLNLWQCRGAGECIHLQQVPPSLPGSTAREPLEPTSQSCGIPASLCVPRLA